MEEESHRPKSPLGGRFGGAKKAKKENEGTVEEESSKSKSPLGGLFGGAQKAQVNVPDCSAYLQPVKEKVVNTLQTRLWMHIAPCL